MPCNFTCKALLQIAHSRFHDNDNSYDRNIVIVDDNNSDDYHNNDLLLVL